MNKETLKIHFKCNSNVNLNAFAIFTTLPIEPIEINTKLTMKLFSEEILPLLTKGIELTFEWNNYSYKATLDSVYSNNGSFIDITILHTHSFSSIQEVAI
jgi:hypothetical protein